MDPNEKEFETFLQQFRARQPRQLPELAAKPQTWTWRFIAVAACIFAAAVLWVAFRKRAFDFNSNPDSAQSAVTLKADSDVVRSMSLGQLTRLALLAPESLDAALTEASERLLLDVEKTDGILNRLAKQ